MNPFMQGFLSEIKTAAMHAGKGGWVSKGIRQEFGGLSHTTAVPHMATEADAAREIAIGKDRLAFQEQVRKSGWPKELLDKVPAHIRNRRGAEWP